MQAFLVRRGLFAASILAISGIAATGHADDGGADAGLDAGVAVDASQQDASPNDAAADAAPIDATVVTPADGSTPAADAADEFDLLATDAGPIQEDGALPPYSGGNVFNLLCLQDPATNASEAPFAFSKLPAPYPDAAGCMKYADQGHAAVHTCYCGSCFDLMQQCDAVEGCKEILKCELDNAAACTTATGCYFGPCGTVIDKWNNTSVAAFLPTLLQKCGAAATPACPTN